MSDKPQRCEAELRGTLDEPTVFDQPAGPENLKFVKRLGRYLPRAHEQARLRNNLRKAVGLLEVANLGDVAANVWNTVPIPTYIVFFMILGGIIAWSMLYFVVTDANLSLQNRRGLEAERRRLLKAARGHDNYDPERMSIDSFLHVNHREQGSELVDRFGMLILLGAGAFLVGIGTFMAPFGANTIIFEASNYLTGYIGNAPCAIYGLLNVGWAFFVCTRAYGHRRAIEQHLKDDTIILEMVKKRTTRIYVHAVLNGITALAAGAAAMLTATQRFAYPVLVPCCISSFYLNWYWRSGIGYDRPLQEQGTDASIRTLRDAIEVTIKHRQALRDKDLKFPTVMEYIVKHHLFEDFCLQMLNDRRLRRILFREIFIFGVDESGPITIKRRMVVSRVAGLNPSNGVHIFNAAKKVALRFCRYRERWLLEILGCYMAIYMTTREQEGKRPEGEGDSKLLDDDSSGAGTPIWQGYENSLAARELVSCPRSIRAEV